MNSTHRPRSEAVDFAPRGSTSAIEEGAAFAPKLADGALVAAVATDAESGEVLMLAWMDREALALTLETRVAHFYSRSRKRLWRKGEESGNTLEVLEVRTDCDQDAVWLKVRTHGAGVACHTGRRTCFYRRVPLGAPSGATWSLQPVDDASAGSPGQIVVHPAKKG